MTTENQWFGHPRGLSTLFFTEMWERFSFYGMRAILLLFMTAPAVTGGLAFPTEKAATIYGWYTMLVYAAAIPGGWIADRLIGQYRAVFAGGVIIALGHFSMAVPRIETFFLGLGLIVIGTGLLKPNVSTMVGSLYSADDARRDSGFSIYYMGINLGAMISPLVCGYLGQKVSWHIGFAAAGVGMIAGLVQYVIGRRHVWDRHSCLSDAQTGMSAPHVKLTVDEWKRVGVIMTLFFFAVLFWGAYEQAGSSLTLFADRFTRLSILGWEFPSSWFQSLPALYVITLAPVFAWMWVRLGRREPSSPAKFAIGVFLVGLGFLLIVPAARYAQTFGARVSPLWLVALYLIHVLGELCLSPVGLSLVTKLSPPRVVGVMMGVWFLATAFGNFLAGWVATFFDRIPVYQLFATIFIICATAAFLLVVLIRPIRSMTGAHDEDDDEADEAHAALT